MTRSMGLVHLFSIVLVLGQVLFVRGLFTTRRPGLHNVSPNCVRALGLDAADEAHPQPYVIGEHEEPEEPSNKPCRNRLQPDGLQPDGDTSGWAFGQAFFNKNITAITAIVEVPPAPSDVVGSQIIYFYAGLWDEHSSFQALPLLMWGRPPQSVGGLMAWWLLAGIVSTSGQFIFALGPNVSAGDAVTLTAVYNPNSTWTISVSSKDQQKGAVLTTASLPATASYNSAFLNMQTFGVDNCATKLPQPPRASFTNAKVMLQGKQTRPTWKPVLDHPPCNTKVKITSASEVDLQWSASSEVDGDEA